MAGTCPVQHGFLSSLITGPEKRVFENLLPTAGQPDFHMPSAFQVQQDFAAKFQQASQQAQQAATERDPRPALPGRPELNLHLKPSMDLMTNRDGAGGRAEQARQDLFASAGRPDFFGSSFTRPDFAADVSRISRKKRQDHK